MLATKVNDIQIDLIDARFKIQYKKHLARMKTLPKLKPKTVNDLFR